MEDPKKAAAPCDPPSICSAELACGKNLTKELIALVVWF